jgi:DNA-directed RNA polymerase specialized sigma24 family protein
MYKPSPDTIKFRMRLYAENRFHRPLCSLRPEQRMSVVYCLHECFQFPNSDIACLLSCSNSSIWRDLQAANVYKNSSEFMSRIKSIEDYILYIAKYIY